MNALPAPRPTTPSLPGDISAVVAAALAEDVGTGDITADLIDPNKLGRAQVIAREPATLCGCAWSTRPGSSTGDPRVATRDDADAPTRRLRGLISPARRALR
jgi:nicotinate-nucleotide pyrophosphorylase (carboxylating)